MNVYNLPDRELHAWVLGPGGSGIVNLVDLIERHLDAGHPLPDFLVGSSAGGLMSILMGHLGFEGAKREVLKITKRKDVFSGDIGVAIGKLGMWSNEPLRGLIKDVIESGPAKIPWWVTGADVKNKGTQYFKEKDGWYHATSTACIPILVEPLDCYVDGGLTESKPFRFPIDMGATVIDVFHCFAKGKAEPKMPKSIFELGIACLETLQAKAFQGDAEILRLKNMLSKELGKKVITLREHYPKENLIGSLEFERIGAVYKKLKERRE